MTHEPYKSFCVGLRTMMMMVMMMTVLWCGGGLLEGCEARPFLRLFGFPRRGRAGVGAPVAGEGRPGVPRAAAGRRRAKVLNSVLRGRVSPRQVTGHNPVPVPGDHEAPVNYFWNPPQHQKSPSAPSVGSTPANLLDLNRMLFEGPTEPLSAVPNPKMPRNYGKKTLDTAEEGMPTSRSENLVDSATNRKLDYHLDYPLKPPPFLIPPSVASLGSPSHRQPIVTELDFRQAYGGLSPGPPGQPQPPYHVPAPAPPSVHGTWVPAQNNHRQQHALQ